MVGSAKVVASESRDVLNYFGKCPVCDYPTRAMHITAEFDDGRVESQTIASCGGWCGWKGPVAPTTMTGSTAVMTPSRDAVRAEPLTQSPSSAVTRLPLRVQASSNDGAAPTRPVRVRRR